MHIYSRLIEDLALFLPSSTPTSHLPFETSRSSPQATRRATMARFTSLLLAAALIVLLLINTVSAQRITPSREHIGTPAQHAAAAPQPQRITPSHDHIGTPAQHPASSEHLSPQLAALSKPRIPSYPEKLAERLESRRHHTKHASALHIPHGKVTYYAGGQLANPACGGKTPNDGSMIAAISFDSPFGCGDKIRILDNDSGRQQVVTVVDRCAGCTREWIDVTKGVFSIFDSLDAGVLHDVSFTKV